MLFKCLFNRIVDYYNSLPSHNPDETCVLMVAPTGKAAFLFGGVTMHTALRILFGKNLNTPYQPLDPRKRNKIRSELQHIKYIFIDEMSMSGCLLFNNVNNFLRDVFSTNKPFGGLSVFTSRAFYQLPPVKDYPIFMNPRKGYLALLPNIWQEYFQMFNLTEIMRQEGKDFAEVLNQIYVGQQTSADILYINK